MDSKMQNFKRYYLKSPAQNEKEMNITDADFAELLLEKSLFDFKKQQIKNEIDKSLAQRNKAEFLRLATELKNLSVENID